MLLSRNSGRKDTDFLLIDKCLVFFSLKYLLYCIDTHLCYEYRLGYRNRIASSAQAPMVKG